MASATPTVAHSSPAIPQISSGIIEKAALSVGIDRPSNDEAFTFTSPGVGDSVPCIDTSIFTSLPTASFNELLQQFEDPVIETSNMYQSSLQQESLTILPLDGDQNDECAVPDRSVKDDTASDDCTLPNSFTMLPEWPICSCSMEVVKEEVPVEQVFIRDGQMYRLPDACVLCIGKCELYGFYKEGQWYISVTALFQMVGDEAMKHYEKAILRASQLDIMTTGDNELELLIQKGALNPDNTVRDLISVACLQEISRYVCETVDHPVVRDFAYGDIYRKVLGNNVRCSNCGLTIKKDHTFEKYELIWKDGLVKEDTTIDDKVPVTLGIVTASNEKFNAFQLNGNVYVSFKELVRHKLFSLPTLRRKLISLDISPMQAPSEVEAEFISNNIDMSRTLWLDLVTLRCLCCMGSGRNNIRGHDADVWQAFKMGKCNYKASSSLLADDTTKFEVENSMQKAFLDRHMVIARAPVERGPGECNSVEYITNTGLTCKTFQQEVNDFGSDDHVSSTTEGFQTVTSKCSKQEIIMSQSPLINQEEDSSSQTVYEVNETLNNESNNGIFECKVAEPSGEVVEVKVGEVEASDDGKETETITGQDRGQQESCMVQKNSKTPCDERVSVAGPHDLNRYIEVSVSETMDRNQHCETNCDSESSTSRYSEVRLTGDTECQGLVVGRPRGRPTRSHQVLVFKSPVETSTKRGNNIMLPGDYIIPDIDKLNKQIQSKKIQLCEQGIEYGLPIIDDLGITQKGSKLARLIAAGASRHYKKNSKSHTVKDAQSPLKTKIDSSQDMQAEQKINPFVTKKPTSAGNNKAKVDINRLEDTGNLNHSETGDKKVITEYVTSNVSGQELIINEKGIEEIGLTATSEQNSETDEESRRIPVKDNIGKHESIIQENLVAEGGTEVSAYQNSETCGNSNSSYVRNKINKHELTVHEEDMEKTGTVECTNKNSVTDGDSKSPGVANNTNKQALITKEREAGMEVCVDLISERDKNSVRRQELVIQENSVERANTDVCTNVSSERDIESICPGTGYNMEGQLLIKLKKDNKEINTESGVSENSKIDGQSVETHVAVNIDLDETITQENVADTGKGFGQKSEISVVDSSSSPLKNLIYSQSKSPVNSPPSRRVERLCTQLASLEKLNRPDISLHTLATIAAAENESESDVEQDHLDTSNNDCYQLDTNKVNSNQLDTGKVDSRDHILKEASRLNEVLPETQAAMLKDNHKKIERMLSHIIKLAVYSFDKELDSLTVKKLNKRAAVDFPALFAPDSKELRAQLSILMSLYMTQKYRRYKSHAFMSAEQRARENTEVNYDENTEKVSVDAAVEKENKNVDDNKRCDERLPRDKLHCEPVVVLKRLNIRDKHSVCILDGVKINRDNTDNKKNLESNEKQQADLDTMPQKKQITFDTVLTPQTDLFNSTEDQDPSVIQISETVSQGPKSSKCPSRRKKTGNNENLSEKEPRISSELQSKNSEIVSVTEQNVSSSAISPQTNISVVQISETRGTKSGKSPSRKKKTGNSEDPIGKEPTINIDQHNQNNDSVTKENQIVSSSAIKPQSNISVVQMSEKQRTKSGKSPSRKKKNESSKNLIEKELRISSEQQNNNNDSVTEENQIVSNSAIRPESDLSVSQISKTLPQAPKPGKSPSRKKKSLNSENPNGKEKRISGDMQNKNKDDSATEQNQSFSNSAIKLQKDILVAISEQAGSLSVVKSSEMFPSGQNIGGSLGRKNIGIKEKKSDVPDEKKKRVKGSKSTFRKSSKERDKILEMNTNNIVENSFVKSLKYDSASSDIKVASGTDSQLSEMVISSQTLNSSPKKRTLLKNESTACDKLTEKMSINAEKVSSNESKKVPEKKMNKSDTDNSVKIQGDCRAFSDQETVKSPKKKQSKRQQTSSASTDCGEPIPATVVATSEIVLSPQETLKPHNSRKSSKREESMVLNNPIPGEKTFEKSNKINNGNAVVITDERSHTDRQRKRKRQNTDRSRSKSFVEDKRKRRK